MTTMAKNKFYMRMRMIPETDRAYIAGLFDGEVRYISSVDRKRKKHRGKPGYESQTV